jgi:mono/diheme cytochrome c family protein
MPVQMSPRYQGFSLTPSSLGWRASARDVCPAARTIILLAVLTAGLHSSLLAQSSAGGATVEAGKVVFRKGCITCHGPDGRGTPRSTLGFDPPPTFPDFTACKATAREPNHDLKAIVTNGGPARGFSEIMPSFGEALTAEQIDNVIQYLRSLCLESSWPRGEMNLPRGLMTEKAFPEDEAIITSAINAEGDSQASFKMVYEQRFGARNQIEVSVPFSFAHPESESWRGGIGDIGLGYKRLLVSSLRSGSILSVVGEAIFPTGDRTRDFGTGVMFFETFAAYGQLLPKKSFLQFQSGIELPTRTEEANRAVYWRINFGKSMSQGMGFGRMWSPMVELLADRELASGAKTNWDILPQFQVTLSRRQHIRANFGVKFPITDAGPRTTQVWFYLLWDWFDGGLRDGWK